MRGRKPKPTQLKILAGNPGCRPLPEDEPAAPAGEPKCPAYLDREGKAEWKRVTAALRSMGLLSTADRGNLIRLCQNWSLAVRLSRLVNDLEGEPASVHMDARKLLISHAEAWNNYGRAAVEFGLTPSSRARVHAPGKKSEEVSKKRFFGAG